MSNDVSADPYWANDQWMEPHHWITRPLTAEHAPSAKTRYRINRVLSWLVSYHHITANQLARIMGKDEARLAVEAARRLDLIHVGYSDHRWAPDIYRLSRTHNLSGWLANLNYDEWVGVCGARPLVPSIGHQRHDILGAEIACRAEDISPMAVFGEQLSKVSYMLPKSGSFSHGDLTIVRADGLRMIIEITASLPDDFPRKIASWGRLLGKTPLSEHGIVVVLLAAAMPHHQSNILRNIFKYHAQTLTPQGMEEQLSEYALYSEITEARHNILVADWREWFPRESDQSLVAMPATWLDPDGNRRVTNLADINTYPFAPSPSSTWPWMAPLANRSRLYSQI